MQNAEFDWKNPDYAPIYTERAGRLKRIREEGLIKGLKEYYKERPVEFISDWGMTFDPRNLEVGKQAAMPFVLFPRQREFIQWLYDGWRGREDGLAEKSRDMGVSWLCVAFGVWMWLFHPGAVIGFGSRKEEYVDKLGDPKSLFEKIRMFLDHLPGEFMPRGWDRAKHAIFTRVLNPETGAVIAGEAGDNIGRGARASIYFVDEAAFIERSERVDAALSATSNCKVYVSTPNGNGNVFYRKRVGGRIRVFTFRWNENPLKDQAWYDKQKQNLDPVAFAQEIEIDYNASSNDVWIPGDLVSRAQLIGPADVVPVGPWMIGIDAAHQGDDESVIHRRRGRLNLPQITRRGADGPQLAALVNELVSQLSGPIGAIIIELDGPGVSCYDHLRMGKHGQYVVGVHTGARQQDDRNYNLRAKMWREALEYLKDDPVSLPNDAELKSQLSSVANKYKDGLLLMEAKKDYKSRLGKSPDRADAFVLTFAANPVEVRTVRRVEYVQTGTDFGY